MFENNAATTIARPPARKRAKDPDSDVEEIEVPAAKKKSNGRAKASGLRKAIRPTSDYSINLYRAMLAHNGGFLEDGKDLALAVKALTISCKKFGVAVENEDEYNDLISLVSDRYL